VGVCCISYNHSRDDEEVYKEFLEIANEIIPQILRMDQNGILTRDPAVYALLLQFYDGLCCWEEESQTPVLHITWATHMLSSIGKFDVEARTSVELLNGRVDDNKMAEMTPLTVNGSVAPHSVRQRHSVAGTEVDGKYNSKLSTSADSGLRRFSDSANSGLAGFSSSTGGFSSKADSGLVGGFSSTADRGLDGLQVAPVDYCESVGSSEVSPGLFGADTSQLSVSGDALKMDVVVEQLAGQSDDNDDEGDCSSEIVALAHACGESLLNPDFLRGSGEPFVKDDAKHQLLSSVTDTQMDLNEFAACADAAQPSDVGAVTTGVGDTAVDSEQRSEVSAERRPQLVLRSAKMLALKQLFVASKLNASAIKLHLTAQSQVSRKPTQVGRPLSTQFITTGNHHHRRTVKRRAVD